MLDFFKSMCKDLYIAKKENNKEFVKKMKPEFDIVKKACSRRLIFYKLLNVKIPRKAEEFLINETHAQFISQIIEKEKLCQRKAIKHTGQEMPEPGSSLRPGQKRHGQIPRSEKGSNQNAGKNKEVYKYSDESLF